MGLIPRELGSTIVDFRVSFCTNAILNRKEEKKEGREKEGAGSGRRGGRVGEGAEAGRGLHACEEGNTN